MRRYRVEKVAVTCTHCEYERESAPRPPRRDVIALHVAANDHARRANHDVRVRVVKSYPGNR